MPEERRSWLYEEGDGPLSDPCVQASRDTRETEKEWPPFCQLLKYETVTFSRIDARVEILHNDSLVGRRGNYAISPRRGALPKERMPSGMIDIPVRHRNGRRIHYLYGRGYLCVSSLGSDQRQCSCSNHNCTNQSAFEEFHFVLFVSVKFSSNALLSLAGPQSSFCRAESRYLSIGVYRMVWLGVLLGVATWICNDATMQLPPPGLS